jgi:tetratricopeptide (TPR) repeat protein
VWPHRRVVELVTDEFAPVRVHVRDHADEFQRLGERYDARWTPMILVLDPSGQERHRVEGFLPVDELVPQLEFGLGRVAFSRGEFEEAERRFRRVVEDAPDADVAPEALYWAGVARFKATDDAEALKATASAFHDRYQETTWAKKASVWD